MKKKILAALLSVALSATCIPLCGTAASGNYKIELNMSLETKDSSNIGNGIDMGVYVTSDKAVTTDGIYAYITYDPEVVEPVDVTASAITVDSGKNGVTLAENVSDDYFVAASGWEDSSSFLIEDGVNGSKPLFGVEIAPTEQTGSALNDEFAGYFIFMLKPGKTFKDVNENTFSAVDSSANSALAFDSAVYTAGSVQNDAVVSIVWEEEVRNISCTHQWDEKVVTPPMNEQNGSVKYICSLCGATTSLVRDSGEYQPGDLPDTTKRDDGTVADVDLKSESVLYAAGVNTFRSVDALGNLRRDYTQRGAGLRIDDTPSTQSLRFTESIKIPKNAKVTDFGIVYTLSKSFAAQGFEENPHQADTVDYNNIVLGAPKTAYISYQNGTLTNYTLYAPDGVAVDYCSKDYFESADYYMTFNLVISGIAQKNYTRYYAARAFVTYESYGMSFTVYDDTCSSRSVFYVADKAYNACDESGNFVEKPDTRAYLYTNVLRVADPDYTERQG